MDKYLVVIKGKQDGEKQEVSREINAQDQERAEEWGKIQANTWKWTDIKSKATQIIKELAKPGG